MLDQYIPMLDNLKDQYNKIQHYYNNIPLERYAQIGSEDVDALLGGNGELENSFYNLRDILKEKFDFEWNFVEEFYGAF